MVPVGSVGFNVLNALLICPMTFDAIKKRVVDEFTYTDVPDLRRRLAKAVYEMHLHGYVDRRGDHGPSSFAKYRRWQITPAGRDAIDASMAEYLRGQNEEEAPEDKALDAVVEGKLD